MQSFFHSISHPALAGVFATLTICLIIVVILAAISRDRQSVRIGVGLALLFAAMCASTKLSLALGWIELELLIALVFASWAHAEGRSFWVWFVVTALFGLLIALVAYWVADWARNRRSKYGATGVAAPSTA